MTQVLPNDGAVGDSRDEPQQPLTAKRIRPESSRLVIRLDSGEAWIALPETAVPVVHTPHAVATSSRAGLVARVGPQRTTVTVAHSTVTVSGSTDGQEISREEAIDVSTDGALGKPLRLDPRPRSPGAPNCTELTGWAVPVASGSTRKALTLPQKVLDREVRLRINQEMDHEREQITAVYLGRCAWCSLERSTLPSV